jgi:hypothetical protein
VSVSAPLWCVNSILPAGWQIRPGGPSLCTPTRILIIGRRHLERVLRAYTKHYNEHRPHRALKLAPPDGAIANDDRVTHNAGCHPSPRPARRTDPRVPTSSLIRVCAAHGLLRKRSSTITGAPPARGSASGRSQSVKQEAGPAPKSVRLKAPRLARIARWWVAGSGRNLSAGPVQNILRPVRA